tara:strand:+ start:70034 stop:70288 length:255 start_codon:yes stop_codon:yes gene_type:complete
MKAIKSKVRDLAAVKEIYETLKREVEQHIIDCVKSKNPKGDVLISQEIRKYSEQIGYYPLSDWKAYYFVLEHSKEFDIFSVKKG